MACNNIRQNAEEAVWKATLDVVLAAKLWKDSASSWNEVRLANAVDALVKAEAELGSLVAYRAKPPTK